jgi:DNA-binding response OmpR family regulator
MSETLRILLVEDDDDTAEALMFWLESDGFVCRRARAVREAMLTLDAEQRSGDTPDAVILDLMLPDGGGGVLGEWIARTLPACAIVIYSAAPQAMITDAARQARASAAFRKPSECATIAAALRVAIDARRAEARSH